MVSGLLKQSLMDCKESCTLPIPWIWVFDTLTSSNQVDLSLLLDLLKKIPDISDDIYRDARELVSLSILESICIQIASLNSGSCTSSPKIGFDPVERCEDVLRGILPETSPLDLTAIGVKMLHWDIQPFVAHKRSCVSRRSLQKLKEAIITGSYPPLLSLKELSGLRGGNQPKDKAPAIHGDSNGNKPRREGSNTNSQICPENDQLVSPDLADGSNILCGNLLEENLLPAEKKRTAHIENALRNSSKGQMIQEDGCTANIKAVEKHKPGVISSEQDLGAKLTSLDMDRQTSGPIMTIIPSTGEETESLENETHVGGMRLKEPVWADGCNSCKGHGGLHEVLPCEKHSPRCDTEALIDKSNQEYWQDHDIEGLGQARNIKNTERDKEGFHQCNTMNGNMNTHDEVIKRNFLDGGGDEVVISGENDWFHDETSDIVAKKNAFLSSQCTFSQDSLVTDYKELNLCVKCNKGGILLVCCSKSCPLVIHESCLACDASFDGEGNFYCPFCAYSRAISNYFEAKEKASLARNNLTTFISLGSMKETENEPHRSCKITQNHLEHDNGLPNSNEDFEQHDGLPKSKEVLKQGHGIPKSNEDFKQGDGLPKSNEDFKNGDGMPKCNELNNINFVKKVSCKRRKKIRGKQAGPSVLDSGDSPTSGQNDVASSEATLNTLEKGKQAGKRTGQVCRSLRVNEKHQKATLPICNSENGKASCQVQERSDGDAGIRHKDRVLSPPETDKPYRYECSPSYESASTEEKSEDSATSKYFIRVRKQGKQYSFPAIPQLKRKRVPWTSEEEEKLKEGMQKICGPHDKTIPWKKILEFGGGTFDGSRTTIDLKDKWRNICKAASKS